LLELLEPCEPPDEPWLPDEPLRPLLPELLDEPLNPLLPELLGEPLIPLWSFWRSAIVPLLHNDEIMCRSLENIPPAWRCFIRSISAICLSYSRLTSLM
jgi:hypothetical protein